jgi:hypothetical protein
VGLLTAAAGTVWLLTAVLWIIPAFRSPGDGGEWGFVHYWSGFGTTQGEVLRNLLNPLAHARNLLTPDKLAKSFDVFSVFLFLPLLSGRALVFLVLPPWFILFSSDNPLLWGLSIYYGLLITPFLFRAALDGLANLRRWTGERRGLVTVAVLGMLLVNLGNSRVGKHLRPSYWEDPQRVATARAFVGKIPPGEAVAAQIQLQSALPVQGKRYLLPRHLDKARWALFDLEGDPYPVSAEDNQRLLTVLRSDPDWEVVAEADGYVLLRRRG